MYIYIYIHAYIYIYILHHIPSYCNTLQAPISKMKKGPGTLQPYLTDVGRCRGGELILGLAVNTSMWARARLPVAHGPMTNPPPRHWKHLFKTNNRAQDTLDIQDDIFVAEGVLHLPSGPYETWMFHPNPHGCVHGVS